MLPPLPSSNRTGRFPASGFPENIQRQACTGSYGWTLKELQAKALQLDRERHPFRRSEGSLAPTLQVVRETFEDEPVDLPIGGARITVREVEFPALQDLVDLSDQFRNRKERPGGADQPPQFVPQPLQSLVRRKHVQIAPSATISVPIVAERVAHEVHTRSRMMHLHHPRLLSVDRQPESAFDLLFHPRSQPIGLFAGQDHEVVRIA